MVLFGGRAASLEEKIKQPLLSPFEIGMGTPRNLVRRVSASPEYRGLFKRLFILKRRLRLGLGTFWVVGAGWTAAGALRRGSALLTKDGLVVHIDSH